jgi:hypothetical protein
MKATGERLCSRCVGKVEESETSMTVFKVQADCDCLQAVYSRNNLARQALGSRSRCASLMVHAMIIVNTCLADRCISVAPLPYHSLFSTFCPDPLLVLLPLRLDIEESPPALARLTLPVAAEAAVQAQKGVWVALAEHLFSLSRVLALAMPALPRQLAGPLRGLYGA